MFVHWLACIFFLIFDCEASAGISFENTWVGLIDEDDTKTAFDMYIASASWALTTVATVGYGDIYSVTNAEKVFGLFAMMTACGVFAYMVGKLTIIFDKND